MSDNKLQRAQQNSAASYFTDTVANQLRNMDEVISDGEARRLTANIVTKASAALTEAGEKGWQNVDSQKFVMDIVTLVTLGLDAANNECYIIPYKNNKTGKLELQGSPSSKGLKKLVTEHAIGEDKIISFEAMTIRKNDKFNLKKTPGDDIWSYEPELFGSSPVVGYVSIVSYDNGRSSVMVHSKEDIDKRRDASRAKNSPAWTKWYDEMAHAKAIRRHANTIPWAMPKTVTDKIEELETERPEPIDVTPDTINLDKDRGHYELEEPQDEPQDAPAEHVDEDTSWMEDPQ